MRTLKDLLKRLLCWALLLALLVLAAAGTVLGVQGWKLYRATQPELPAAQLYETLSARPGFTTCDAIPQVLPWVECPVAAASAWSLVGTPIGDVRRAVRSTFHGTHTCTHLNDLLRSVGDVPALIGRL